MSQLLVVAGAPGQRRTALYDRLLRLYWRCCGARPADEARLPGHDIAHFGRPRGDWVPIARSGATFAACAGTWFYRGRAGTLGLQAVCEDLANSARIEDVLENLDGFFALVVPGTVPDSTTVATDRQGILHLYEARLDGCLVLATSSLVLAAASGADWNLDGVREYVALGNVFEERTLFQGIRKLPPATLLSYSGREGEPVAERLWWDQAAVSWDRAAIEGTEDALASSLQEALHMIGRNFDNTLIDLTGGFDSRAIYAAALNAGVAFSTMVAGRPDHPDVVCARRIAGLFGTAARHRELPAFQPDEWLPRLRRALTLCDGECDLFPYARVLNTQDKLWPEFQVTVNGSAGGITKGLWWELLGSKVGQLGHFDARKVAARRYATRPEPERLWARRFEHSLTDHFTEVIRRVNRGFEGSRNTAVMDNTYLRIRLHRWMGRTASSTVRLWDCVTPFVLRRPLETMLAAPAQLRARFGLARRLIERQNPRLAQLPVAEGYPAAPMRWSNVHRFGIPMAMEQLGQIGRAHV